MNKLPLVLEEIICDYKYQLENADRYKKVMAEIRNIKYDTIGVCKRQKSTRLINNKKTTHYCIYGEKNFLMNESHTNHSYTSIYVQTGYNIRCRRFKSQIVVREY